ncbi:hypothetical protein C8Q70DRAFT_34142 [Cubamyces menziesii]|nr:hypothetical protein C8Q70DRAFT_34142 [Cubamyces menziesii]
MRYNKALFWAFCTREFLQPISFVKTRACRVFPSSPPSAPSLPPRKSARQACLTRPSPRLPPTIPRSTRLTTTQASQRRVARTTHRPSASAVVPRAVRTRKLLLQRPLQLPQGRPATLPAGQGEGPQRGSQRKKRRPRVGSPRSLPLNAREAALARIRSRSHPEGTQAKQVRPRMHPLQRKSGAVHRRTRVERPTPPPIPSPPLTCPSCLYLSTIHPSRTTLLRMLPCTVYLLPTLMTLHDLISSMNFLPSSPYSRRYSPIGRTMLRLLRYCSLIAYPCFPTLRL